MDLEEHDGVKKKTITMYKIVSNTKYDGTNSN